MAAESAANSPLVRLVACGSVDDGKSTLIGRLLAQTGSVPIDQLETARRTRRPGSTIPSGEIDYSLLTDGLEAEREQGITIDVAYRHLLMPSGRRVIIADAPGHEQYTRNMAVAASTADVALLLVDAQRGLRPQTFRHLTICALMGVSEVIVAVNKLDTVDFDPSVFEDMMRPVSEAAARMGVGTVRAIPVSALEGDNVFEASARTSWYGGVTVLQAIEEVVGGFGQGSPEFRMPVQTVVRADGFRGLAGTVAAGRIRVGDEVAIAGRSEKGTVTRLARWGGDVQLASAGQTACIELEPDLDVSRGDLLTHVSSPALPAERWAADLVWIGEEPLAHGRSYLLVSGPVRVPATVTAIRHQLDVETGNRDAARMLSLNDVGRVEFATDQPVALDPYAECRDTGGFLLVDRVTGDTVAAGMVRFALRRSANVVAHEYRVTRADRERLNGHHGRVLWLTGLSGSGKSTIADATERQLHSLGVRTYVLDGDNIRTSLNHDLGFTPEDRAENVRRVAEVARILMTSGVVVIVALVSPFRADRDRARELFEPGDFVEVHVDTPVELCIERDTKGLYAKAAAGNLPNLSGVGQDYEPPLHPDVTVSGARALDEAVAAVVRASLDDLATVEDAT